MARMGRDSVPVRERRRLEQERLRQEQAGVNGERQEAARAQLYAIDTGMGRCPKRGSTNIETRRKQDKGWEMLFRMPTQSMYTARHCVACGHEWPT